MAEPWADNSAHLKRSLTSAALLVSGPDFSPNQVFSKAPRFPPGRFRVAGRALHRADAIQAAEFLMDYLKSRVPFRKTETGADSETRVAAKDANEDALKRR